jgi:hypothetical protein
VGLIEIPPTRTYYSLERKGDFMSTKTTAKIKKRALPKPGKRPSIQEALVSINRRYGETLARLAK